MDPNTVRVIAFDLDGTLTQHRTPLPAESRAILDRLGTRWKLLMVGAGQCRRIYRQMEGYPIDIIGNYGMQYCEYDRETGAPRASAASGCCARPASTAYATRSSIWASTRPRSERS